MSNGINIPITATVEASQLGALEGSLAALRRDLAQAKKDFEAAAPGSGAWTDAAKRVADLNGRVMDALRPLREVIEANVRADAAQRQLNAAIAAGVNPWTTASSKYRDAQAALQAQTAAAKEAAQASIALARAKAAEIQSSHGDAVMAAQRQMAQDLRDAEAATRRLKAASDELPASQEKLAKGSGQAGLAMLQFGQALEDAQYGLRGVMNNIPGLLLSLGGSAGLAGVISVVLVGISQLNNAFSKANFDGTWIDDVKTAIGDMLGFMSQAEAEARQIAESPASWAKSAEEAYDAQSQAAKKALEGEIALLETRLELFRLTNAERTKEIEHLVALGQIKRLPSPVGTDQWVKDQTDAARGKWDVADAKRVEEIRNAEASKNAADAELAAQTRAAETAKARADGLKKREDKDRQIAQMEADALAAETEAKKLTAEDTATGMPTNADRVNELMKTVGLARAGAAKIRASRDARNPDGSPVLPFPEPGETAGKAEEAAKLQREAAQAAAKKAAEEAAKFQAAQAESRRARERNEAQLKRDMDEIALAQFERAAKDQEDARKKAEDERRGKNREVESLPDTSTAPAPPDVQSSANDAMGGLRRLAGVTDDPVAKAGLGALHGAVADGQGGTAQEVEIVQQMLAKMGNDRTQNMAALQQAIREMEAVQADGTQMQQRMATAFGAVSAAFRSMRSDLDAVIAEFQSYRDTNRR